MLRSIFRSAGNCRLSRVRTSAGGNIRPTNGYDATRAISLFAPKSKQTTTNDVPISPLMKSLWDHFASGLIGTPGGHYLAITATVTTFTVGSIFAQDNDQTNMLAPDDPFDVQLPSVDEDVRIGGFQLSVDRTKWGIELILSNHGLLGRLHGEDVDITVTEVSAPQRATAIGARSLHSERIFTAHAVPGLKIVYGGKPSLFTQDIRAIRYLFVNSAGATICFEARAKTANPDWSEANHLVLNTLSLPRRIVRPIGEPIQDHVQFRL
jgi:hypothetical protein